MSSILNFQPSRLSLLFLLILTSLLPSLTLAVPKSELPVLPLELLSEREPLSLPDTSRFDASSVKSPITSSSCGYARVTSVGISVNKGAKATLRYKIRIKAVSARKLSFSDKKFLKALSATHKESYLSIRKLYKGGLDVPFLRFLGINLDDPKSSKNRNPILTVDEYVHLSDIAFGIMKRATRQKIVAKGKLRATGIRCMTTTAYAFVKIARVNLKDGNELTVLTTKDDDVVAGTKNGDTVLPSDGGLNILNF